MIRLEIADYCNDCDAFEPDVSKREYGYSVMHEELKACDTTVRCENANRCKAIYNRMIEKTIKVVKE